MNKKSIKYVRPESVLSPRNRLKKVEGVLYDGGASKYSVALLRYQSERGVRERLGIRWNGDDKSPIGNPQSRGKATWFVLPDELAQRVREAVEERTDSEYGKLVASYREMAEDREREAEALEWCEGLIADANDQAR